MANASCSQECQAPLYIAMSLTLVFISIATIKSPKPETPLQSGHGLALNASAVLRRHGGFHAIATLLQISPDLFLSQPQSTIFALHDSSISNLSTPPSAMRQLLRHHVSPSALPMAALLKKPPGFCFKTLVNDNKLVITKNNAVMGSKTRSIMINNVLISHPDIFLEGPLAIHGVLRPFDVIPALPCGFSDQSNFLGPNNTNQAVKWTRIIRLLSSNGFISFAIGLNTVLDEILQDYKNLKSVTIFAPPNSGFISSPSPFLDKIVRIHILPKMFTNMELAAAENSSLRTLVHEYDLKIEKFEGILAVNGVEIAAPDLLLSKNFVIHGISRDFDVVEHFSS